MKILYNITLLLCLISTTFVFSNNINFRPNHSIKVIHTNDTLISPFVGGLTSIQVANADMQNDGFIDLIIFDIYSNRIIVYRNNQNLNYTLDTANYSFPDFYNWIEVLDYNCDNIPDIFTYNNSGSIEIYKGEYVNQKLQFKKKQNQILTLSFFNNNVNVYATAIDKPSFADVNNDGDIDIVGFNVFANKLIYYENQRVEFQLSCDSFYCKIQDFCWGNISESSNDGELNLRDTCTSKFLNNQKQSAIQHNGSNITIQDVNGDGLIDALLGDLFFNQLSYLENEGTQQYASFLSQTKNFPPQKNIAINYLPLAQFVDINHDNKKDLIVSNFSYTSADANDKNVWYYKNSSNNNAMNFEFVEDDFILKECIDVGKNSSICFFDITNDNVLDLIIANGGQKSTNDSAYKFYLKAYQNIGSHEQPIFSLLDTNFLTISQHQLTEIALSTGDIDNDNDIDLIAGTHDGKIVWWENTDANTNTLTYKGHLIADHQITDSLGNFLQPCIYDLDNDHINDIIIGNRSGKIIFLKGNNTTQPSFQLITTNLANIHTVNYDEVFGFAAPYFFDIDSNQVDDLIVGTHTSGIWYYKDFANQYTSNNLIPQKINVKNYQKLTPAFLDNNLFVGNSYGGITGYTIDTNTITSIISKKIKTLNIYPNPATIQFYVDLEQISNINSIKVFNSIGSLINFEHQQNGNQLRIDLKERANGFYFIHIAQGKENYVGKIVLE